MGYTKIISQTWASNYQVREVFLGDNLYQKTLNYLKKQKYLELGNLKAKRDWGHAREYVEAMWLMLKQKTPDDFVISTGKQVSVKNFVNMAAKLLNMKITWKGSGINEKAYDINKKVIVSCDKAYYRPLEVNTLLGSSKKAFNKLKWRPKTDLKELIIEMINEEMK